MRYVVQSTQSVTRGIGRLRQNSLEVFQLKTLQLAQRTQIRKTEIKQADTQFRTQLVMLRYVLTGQQGGCLKRDGV